MLDLALYITRTTKGQVLTDKFYDAPLTEKKAVLVQMETEGILFNDFRLYDLLIKATLQHSSRKIKEEYPVKGDRHQRPAARAADQREVLEALHANLDRITKAMFHDSLSDGTAGVRYSGGKAITARTQEKFTDYNGGDV